MSLLSHYEHVRVIGEGYFSLVKLYRDRGTGQDVAIKVLKESFEGNEDYVHRFEREVQLLEILGGHENIIELLRFECGGDSHLYIMPAADTNLYEYIQGNNNSLTVEERIKLFDQVVAAIKHAHSKGILHRDISPRNILLFSEGGAYKVKVSDFGLGKNLLADSAFTRSVVASYGQLYYVAPEQFDKLKNATIQSDIYSLGRLLDFILTGRTPVTVQATNFKTLVEKATQGEPNLRHESIEDFEQAYESIKSLLGVDEESGDLGTLTHFTKPDGRIDWAVFSRFAIKGNYTDSIYGEYLEPVVNVLTVRENAQVFVEVGGDSIAQFVETFIRRIDELPTVGWPFKATTQFAEILSDIFYLTPNPNVKLLCLKGLWHIGYEHDQWGAQDVMNAILESGAIPQEIQMDFAVAIIESKVSISAKAFSNSNIPPVIKRALLRKSG